MLRRSAQFHKDGGEDGEKQNGFLFRHGAHQFGTLSVKLESLPEQ